MKKRKIKKLSWNELYKKTTSPKKGGWRTMVDKDNKNIKHWGKIIDEVISKPWEDKKNKNIYSYRIEKINWCEEQNMKSKKFKKLGKRNSWTSYKVVYYTPNAKRTGVSYGSQYATDMEEYFFKDLFRKAKKKFKF